MDKAKAGVLRAGVLLFLVLYGFTLLSCGVERMLAPAVTPVRVAKEGVSEQGSFAAALLAGQEAAVQWQMRGSEAKLLEGGKATCFFYRQTAQGPVRSQARCADITPGAENADGAVVVTAALETGEQPDPALPITVMVQKNTFGLKTVPSSAINYVNGASCLMQLVRTADGWQVRRVEVAVLAANEYKAAIGTVEDLDPQATYASGMYRPLADGEKVRVIEHAQE